MSGCNKIISPDHKIRTGQLQFFALVVLVARGKSWALSADLACMSASAAFGYFLCDIIVHSRPIKGFPCTA